METIEIKQRAGHRPALVVLVVSLALFLPTATFTWAGQGVDTAHSAMVAWMLAEHGDPDLSVAPLRPGGELGDSQRVERDGRLLADRFPGASVLAVPFYIVLGPVISNPANAMIPAGMAAATIAAFAIMALSLVLRRVSDPELAVRAALVFAVVSGTWAVSADALWTHGPAQLWLALGMLAMASGHFAVAGLGWGLAVFTRPPLAVVPVVTGLWAAAGRRSALPAVATAATTALGLAAYIWWVWWLFGDWSPLGGYADTALTDNLTSRTPRWYAYGLVMLLVHPARGVLLYMPWLVPLSLSLPGAWRESPTWVRSSAVGGVTYLLVSLYLGGWTGGDFFFGPRYPIETLTLAAPLLLIAYRRTPVSRRRMTHALLVAGGLVHALAAVLGLVA